MSTVYADVFTEGGLLPGVKEVQLRSAEYEHEIAVLEVDDSFATSKRFKTGAPIRIDWGFKPSRNRVFFGYVDHIVPKSRPAVELGDPSPIRVVCVAPTWVFKEGDFLTYHGISAPVAIKRIAEQYRFDTRHIRPHSKVWPVLHQGGRSYWEFMVECARKIGWTMYAEGLELHCTDRKRAMEQARQTAPILRPVHQGGHIRTLRNTVGTTAPVGGDLRVRDAYAVNPRNSRVLSRRNSGATDRPMFRATALAPTFRQAAVDVTFDSLEEADTKLRAAELLNRMPIEAQLDGVMNPRVRVGLPVFVTGMNAADCGHWYVRSTVQTIRGRDTSMQLVLGRDTDEAYTDLIPTGTLPPPPRGARLVNRQWRLA